MHSFDSYFCRAYSACGYKVGINWIRLTIAFAIAASSAVFEKAVQPTYAQASEIEHLIVALDSARFVTREAATQDLVQFGSAVLEPLAVHYFQASPESAWRVKRILTDIGTQSTDEETSLKAIGVLLVLDSHLDDKLESLIGVWRENRSNRALNFLVSKGATVPASDAGQQLFVPRQVVRIRQVPSVTGTRNPLRKGKAKESSYEESLAQIKDIVAGDFETIQKLVFSRLPQQNDDLISGQLMAQAALRGIGVFNTTVSPKTLEFGDTWKGSSNDLEKLKEIHALSAVRFKNQMLTDQDLKILSDLKSLQYFGVENTKVKHGHLHDIELPENVVSIELNNQNIESATLRWLSRLPLASLTVDDCRIARSVTTGLSMLTDLEMLDLRRIDIDSEMFEEFAKMASIRRIILSVCKFDTDDYRDFVEARSQIIMFNPVSFLGVQGTRNLRRPGRYTCEIELVVPNSGADKAGIKAGDVIEAVNGQEVTSFTDLRMFISQHDIGESMKISVLRGKEQLELKAVLGVNENRTIR